MGIRDREIVEDYKKVLSTVFSSPHLHPLDGEWYLLEKEESPDYIASAINLTHNFSSVEKMRRLGYTVTPLIIHKVDTRYTR